uniref:Uncharacterized protein n=1 Tax=Mustela putorius furo TaxID=9669 RepID=M3YXK9_MUSPF
MKSLMLPVPALWVGCCPGGVLAKQGPSLREPMATPTPVGPLTPQPPPPSWPGPPRGAFQHPGSGGQHQKKDHSQSQGSSNTKETTGHGGKRPRSRQGPRHRFTDLGTAERAMPSLPASCVLTQAGRCRLQQSQDETHPCPG